MSCEYCTSRRSFLGLVVLGTAAVGLGSGCSGASGGTEGSLSAGSVNAGLVKDIPVGTLRPISGTSIAIARDTDGLYAMSLICTHEGANMAQQGSVSSSGIRCALHGSRFDVNGGVTQGPAARALAHFAVEIDPASNVIVHTDTEVTDATRTAVS